MNDNLRVELENYISELENLVKRMDNYGFPFSDAAIAYKDVCNHLKTIAEAR